jgi:hypothetical protein
MNDAVSVTAGDRSRQFEELRPWVGARLQLVLSRSPTERPATSSLLGYLVHEYLIVKTPFENGLAVRAQIDEWLKVRLFTGMHLVEFDASVLRQYGTPAWNWHLAYPSVVRVSTLRATQRATVRLEGHAHIAGASDPVAVYVLDLSDLGARIQAEVPLGERETSLRLVFSVPVAGAPEPAQMAIEARIRSVRELPAKTDAAALYAHGVQFENLRDTDRLILQNFVLHRLNDGSVSVA